MLAVASAVCIFGGEIILKGAKYTDDVIKSGIRVTDGRSKVGR